MKWLIVAACLATGLASGLHSASASEADDHENATDFVVTHLQCPMSQDRDGDLAVTPFLKYLVQANFIDVRAATHLDSTSCWDLRRVFDADGLKIHTVCAASDQFLDIEQNPEFYVQDVPMQYTEFVVFTDASTDFVNAWVRRHGISTNLDGEPFVAGPKDPWHAGNPNQKGTMLGCIE